MDEHIDEGVILDSAEASASSFDGVDASSATGIITEADSIGGDIPSLSIGINTPMTPPDLTSRHIEYNEVYEDTLYFVNGIVQEYRFYPEILSMIKSGKTTISMSRATVRKQIELDWVKAIEDCLPHLDKVVRNPIRVIEQNEEVLPIELSRHITSRSIQHLGQHTDYINDVDEKGNITPAKILNVFNDETINTYENRFVNTLLMRLYTFVSKRYTTMFSAENLENSASLNFVTEFSQGDTHGEISFGIKVCDPADSVDAKPGEFSLSDRVRRIYDIVTGYQSSALVKQLGRSYVRPPIMRTNAIMKNKDLKQCLLLWQFIESYEDIGVKIEHEEMALMPDERYLDELYSTLALQYVIFKHNTGTVVDEKKMTVRKRDKVYREPEFIFEVPEVEDEEFTVYDSEYRKFININSPLNKRPLSEDEKKIKEAIEAALIADEFYHYREEDEDREIDPADIFTTEDGRRIRVRYRKSFEAKLIQSPDKTKDYYNDIRSFLLSFKRMKDKRSWSYERYYIGRHSYAKLAIAGKTLNVYLSLDPRELEESKYIFTDASEIKKYQDTPVRLKIRSDRAARWAKELIEIMMAKDGVEQGEISTDTLSIPYEEKLPLIARDLIHVSGTDLATGEAVGEDELKRLLGILPEDAEDTADADGEAPAVAETTHEDITPTEENTAETAEDTRSDQFALYRRSFRAKLIQSDDEVKSYYTAIRARLVGYGMRSSDSWDNESFYITRKQYAKIGINGKTLVLFLALDPHELEGSKYFFEDVGEKKKYERTPLKFKVRSERAVNWAIELIDMMAFADSLEFVEPEPEPPIPMMSTEELIREGLIRVNKEMLDRLDLALTPEPASVTPEEESSTYPEEYSEERREGMIAESEREEAPADVEELVTDLEEGVPTISEGREAPPAYVPEEGEAASAATVAASTEEQSFGGMYIRRSFKGKLLQADDEIKEYYVAIRKKLLSYPKMKSQDSWDNETFHFERNRYARIAISGKSLLVYLALDPEDYEGTKYFFQDCSSVKKYERTPMKLRVRTRRSFSWTLELIDALAEKYGFGEPCEFCEELSLLSVDDIALYDLGLARVDERLLLEYYEKGDPDAVAMYEHIYGIGSSEPELDELALEPVEPRIRYRKSFEAKLIMAEERTKGYYMQLRNELLSFKRVSAWGSFGCESYRRGRVHIAKMTIAGKTLNLYLALEPSDFLETKYIYTDASEKRKYARVPMRLKIRSDRAARWAKELIRILMDRLEIPAGEPVEEYFDIPEESFESLLARGLIRATVSGVKEVKSDVQAEPVEGEASSLSVTAEPSTEDEALTVAESACGAECHSADIVEETANIETAPAETVSSADTDVGADAIASDDATDDSRDDTASIDTSDDSDDSDDDGDDDGDDGNGGRGFMAHFRRIFGKKK